MNWLHPNADRTVCERVMALGRYWGDRRMQANREPVLPMETVDEIKVEGLLSLGLPIDIGGRAANWPTLCEVARIAAHHCPSTSWIITNCAGHNLVADRLPLSMRQAIFAAGPDVIISTASATSGLVIVRDAEGLSISGTFYNSSGIEHADWALLKFADDRANLVYALVSKTDLMIERTWNASGLYATGTNTIKINDLIIKNDRMADWRACVHHPRKMSTHSDEAGYLHRVSLIGYLGTMLIAPILGCAEAAFDHMRMILAKRMANSDDATRNVLDYTAIGQSMLELHSARLIYTALLDELHSVRGVLDEAPMVIIRKQRAEAAFLAMLCRSAIDRMTMTCGMAVISESSFVQHLWRDLQVMCAHLDVRFGISMHNHGQQIIASA